MWESFISVLEGFWFWFERWQRKSKASPPGIDVLPMHLFSHWYLLCRGCGLDWLTAGNLISFGFNILRGYSTGILNWDRRLSHIESSSTYLFIAASRAFLSSNIFSLVDITSKVAEVPSSRRKWRIKWIRYNLSNRTDSILLSESRTIKCNSWSLRSDSVRLPT